MKKALILILCLICVDSQAITGIPDSTTWIYAGFGGGGKYSMLVPDHFLQNKLYAIPDVNAPYVTTDKGENWRFLSQNAGAYSRFGISQTGAFVQSKNNASLMYAIETATAGGLFKSIDGGQTWAKVSAFRGNKGSKTIAIDPNDDNTVYVGNAGVVKKTTDGGATWTDLVTPFGGVGITFIYIDPSSTTLLIGSSANGLAKYVLGTSTLTAITLTGTNALKQLSYDTYTDGSAVEHFCTTAGLKIACTADLGSNWVYTSAVTTGTAYYVSRLASRYLANGNVRFVISVVQASGGAPFDRYSNDGGLTWLASVIRRNTAMNPVGSMAGVGYSGAIYISSDPFDENVFYYTSSFSIERSDDGGANFYEKDSGAPNIVTQDMAIAPNGRRFITAMDTGIQYSDDYGATWIQAIPNATQPYSGGSAAAYGGHYWRIITTGTLADWNAGNGHVIATATMYNSTSLYYVNVVLRSIDNGQTWTRITSGLPGVGLYGDTVWDHGYVRGLSKSADEQTILITMDGSNCQAIATNPSNCSTNLVEGGTFKSVDNGATWHRANGNSDTLGRSSPKKVFEGIAIDPTNSTRVLLGEFAGNQNPAGYSLYHSKNTGSSYTFLSTLPFTFDVAYDSAGHPYAVGTSSGPVIYKSVVTSFGNADGTYGTWQLMHRFFPVGQTSGIAKGLAIDPANNNRIFVSIGEASLNTTIGNRVYVTIGAQNHTGAEWTDITGNLPVVGGCTRLVIDPNEGTQGYLYCISNGAGPWKLNLADSPAVNTGVTKIGTND